MSNDQPGAAGREDGNDPHARARLFASLLALLFGCVAVRYFAALLAGH